MLSIISTKNIILFNHYQEVIIIGKDAETTHLLIEYLHYNPFFLYSQLADLTAID